MTKKFITEEQLFELKYRINSQYNSMPLAQIFLEELHKYNSGAGHNDYRLDLIDSIKPFFHRYVNDFCEVKFPDNSMLLIRFENGVKKTCGIFEGDFYSHIIDYDII